MKEGEKAKSNRRGGKRQRGKTEKRGKRCRKGGKGRKERKNKEGRGKRADETKRGDGRGQRAEGLKPPRAAPRPLPAAFVRRDALPLGTFSKYTWHITNVLQVKQIFDTPEVRPGNSPGAWPAPAGRR